MRFEDVTGRAVEWSESEGLVGNAALVSGVNEVIEEGTLCGCNYWGEIEPSLDTPWQAYLTICGAIRHLTGVEPSVDRVPDNPAGYQPEGPVQKKSIPSVVRSALSRAKGT